MSIPPPSFAHPLSLQGTQSYLPPPPESKIELWVPTSTVDTQSYKTQENHIYHSLRGIGQSLYATVVVDSSVLPCGLFSPLQGPESLRGGNPRKMGKNYKIPLPRSNPLKWGKLAPKRGKITPKIQIL